MKSLRNRLLVGLLFFSVVQADARAELKDASPAGFFRAQVQAAIERGLVEWRTFVAMCKSVQRELEAMELPHSQPAPMKTIVYFVEDVVPLTLVPGGVRPDFDSLIGDIKANVTPWDWHRDGTRAASISEFATNLSITVHHNEKGHSLITEYLKTRRRKK